MRVAIIGGRGMIGQALVRELQNNSHQPTILSRRTVTGETPAGVEIQKWDGENASVLAAILENFDALVNLAGESIGAKRWTKKRLAVIRQSRMVPGKAITDAWGMMKNPPGVLVQASAVGFYGNSDLPLDEGSKPGNDQLANLCREWEASTQAVIARGTRRVVIRSGVVFSRHQGILPQMTLPFKLFVGGPIGNGHQWISWVHLKDEAKAIRFLLENSQCSGVYNLTSPNPVTNAVFGRTLARVIHRPFWFPLPGFTLRLALGEMSSLILEGQPVIPHRLIESGFDFHFSNLESALSNLLGNATGTLEE
jgi:hypothetical protein